MAKIHNDEFKREAVRIALTSGQPRRQVAADLGVGFSTLAKWIQRSRPADLPPAADIVQAILDGRQPLNLTARDLKRLKPLPTSWANQHQVLGFSAKIEWSSKLPHRDASSF